MSRETAEWLNNNCLIGFTDKYGRAWHYDESLQGDEPNHYPLGVPVADVERRLFAWEAVECKGSYSVGETVYEMPGKIIARSDNGAHLGTFADGYQPHQYKEWLLEKVGTLLSEAKNELGISSAVLLQNGAVAAVQVEAPESVKVGNDELRPFIVATTSFNGKYVTSYKRGTTRVVCDNTLDEFHHSADAAFKIKHTKNSKAKISEVREVLEITFAHQEAELEEIGRLMDMAVTDDQFAKIVALVDPIKDGEGSTRSTGSTRSANRNTLYQGMWNHDNRIGDYKGTAWGVIQVFNTYNQHTATMHGKTVRHEANMLNFLSGKVATADNKVRECIKVVCGV